MPDRTPSSARPAITRSDHPDDLYAFLVDHELGPCSECEAIRRDALVEVSAALRGIGVLAEIYVELAEVVR